MCAGMLLVLVLVFVMKLVADAGAVGSEVLLLRSTWNDWGGFG